MSETEEKEEPKIKIKKKKTKLKKKLDEEDQEEQRQISNESNNNNDNEELEKRKKKKRSKTAFKRKKRKLKIEQESDNEDKDNNENDENNEDESPKKRRKRKRKKKKEQKINSSPNSDNDENIDNNNIIQINYQENEEEKPKKKRRKKKKKKKKEMDDEENNNSDDNIENENDNRENSEKSPEKKKKKRLKKRRRKKKTDEEDDNDEKKEEEIDNDIDNNGDNKSTKKKKKRKKKQKKEDELKIDNNEKVLIYDQNSEDKNENLKKENEEIKFTLKSAKKTLLSNPTIEDNLKDEFRIPKGDTIQREDLDYDYSDMNWKITKKSFLEEIEKAMNELNIYDTIDIALISTTNLIKKEYGNFIINNHHEIFPIKNYNKINWAKEPFSLLRDKLCKLSSPGYLIEKHKLFDFSSRACNEYEIYDVHINMLKVSGNDITQKVTPEKYCFIPKEDNDKLKPTLILFFSLNNEQSIILFKEILFFLEDYKEDIIFMPINAPLIQEEKNIYFVMDMLHRYKVYKQGDKFNLYFCNDDSLNKRFKYISNDNKKSITNKVVYLDVINDKLMVRAIRDLDNFTFNLINKAKNINKEQHKSIINNLFKLRNSPDEFLKGTPLIEPFNCNWILKKAKIYSISKEDQKLKNKITIYDGLTGSTNGEHLYFQDKQMYMNLFKLFKNLGNYQLRFSPKKFSLSSAEKNKLIIDEMNKCLRMNDKLKNVKYQSIFQTQDIILSIGSNFGIKKFLPIESNSFKLELQVDINLFEELIPLNIIGSMQGLTLYTYFNNCDYIACYPKIGEIFPNEFTLTDTETFQEIQVQINPDGDKPSLLIIFSLALQNFFASNELSSRFKLIRNKLEKIYKEKKLNIYLIYRGEPNNFSERFDQIKDEQIFSLCSNLYIKSSSNLKFPLIYQNNDIESTDSQIMSFILNKENKLVYSGNLEDIHIDKTFESLYNDSTGEIDNVIIYKNNTKLMHDEYINIIKIIKENIENIIEKELNKEEKLFYRPFFSISYNSYANFEDDSTDDKKYINHNRLRILIKEKHINIFQNNEEFRKLSNELKKKYNISTIVVSIECANININPENNCDKCNKIINIENNEPWYFEEDSQKIFCEKCGEEYSNDIKYESFITYFNTNEYKDELIQEMYINFLKRNENINPVLGDICKICRNKIGDAYYLNMTHFNIEYSESPIIPIDICESCFNEMKNGDPFLNDAKKRINYEKFGLDYKFMIYRKIYLPLTGRF